MWINGLSSLPPGKGNRKVMPVRLQSGKIPFFGVGGDPKLFSFFTMERKTV
jgi:hypothetical protein